MARTIDLGLVRGGAALGDIVNIVYPVGSIYMSVNDVSPQTLFGGEWEAIQGRFLLGADASVPAGSEGGEAEVALQEAHTPPHTHTADAITGYFRPRGADASAFWNGSGGASANGAFSIGATWESGYYMGRASGLGKAVSQIDFNATPVIHEAGGGEAHNNMPPYLAVYMWKRTA